MVELGLSGCWTHLGGPLRGGGSAPNVNPPGQAFRLRCERDMFPHLLVQPLIPNSAELED